ncbi:MAG: EF-P beta-lysylation protein EpmB [Methylophaga sp.]|nr:EF-P beta-lysylation protein EpmB [Methylophaga sp.]
MIPQSQPCATAAPWQQLLAESITSAEELLQRLGLQTQLQTLDPLRLKKFPVKVTASYMSKMRYGDARDPLLLQVFPLIDEAYEAEGFVADPVGDHQAVRQAGMLQKYQGRALLLTTGACAIHCRYCFRRHFPYSSSNPLASQWQQTLETLAADSSIKEVILSGGDPLVLSDQKLSSIIADLSEIKHIERLRIHSRLPLVLPERITEHLCCSLSESRLNVIMVIHANHANEFDEATAKALSALQQAGCQLLNQTVLLRGINDSADALCQLSEQLSACGVLPYYLHLLDPVAGASHFDVPQDQGEALITTMRQRLSGYLVPRLVREIAGQPSKTIMA